MRMITLGSELLARGVEVELLAHQIPTELGRLAQKAGLRPLARASEQSSPFLAEEISRGVYSHIVLDGYEFSPITFQRLNARDELVIAFDDNGEHAGKPCDVIVNQNMHASEKMYAGYSTEPLLLLGPNFILLRPDVRAQRGLPVTLRDGVLLSLGGTDSLGLRKHLIENLSALSSLPLLLAEGLIGNTRTSPSDLANFMRTSRVGVIALGTTLWEALYLGLPIVGLVVADNQLLAADSLEKEGIAKIFDVRKSIDLGEISRTTTNLYESESLLQARSEKAMTIVDGLGTTRVADHLLAL